MFSNSTGVGMADGMSDCQDEAYTEAMDEIATLKAQAETKNSIISLRNVEIKRLKQTATDLQRECENRGSKIADLERLLIRAADALEELNRCFLVEDARVDWELIARLRKVA